MAGFEIVFEAVDQASPTIQRLSQQLLEAAQRSDRFAGQVVNATSRADRGFSALPPKVDATAQSMAAVQAAAGQLLNQLAGFATAAGIGAFFKASADAALAEEEALRRLQFAVEATGGSFGQVKDRIVAFAQEQQNLTRFSDTQTYEALGKLVRVTGNAGQAMQATRLAFGLASASGKDLNTVLDLLGPILNGDATRLRALKGEFGAFIGDADTAQEVLDALSQRFLGAAEAESGYARQLGSLRNRLDDFKEVVGAGVLPVFRLFLDALLKGAQFAEILSATIVFNLGGKAFAVLQQTWRGWAAIFKCEWDKLPQIVEDADQRIQEVEDITAKSLLEIHQRYSQERQTQAEDQAGREVELKARVTQKSIEESDREAQAKERRAQEAQDFLFRIEDERLELTGQTVEANIAQYEREAAEREQTLFKMALDGQIAWGQYQAAVETAQQVAALKSQQSRDSVNQDLQAMRQTAEAVGSVLENRFASAFSAMALEGKSFEESMKGIWKDIARVAIEELTRIAVRAAIVAPIVAGITGGAGGGAGGGIIGSIIGKLFHEGGVVRKPTVGILGEAGPEAVIPLDRLGSLAGPGEVNVSISQTYNITAGGVGDDQVRTLMRRISEATRSGAAEGAELVKSILARQGRLSKEAV